ncbi:protein of unknown function [Caballeronia sp. S22]
MNSTRATEVSIQAVSPELILEESTMTGSVGAAGAASDAPDAGAAADAASADDAIAVLAEAGALAAVSDDAGAEAAAGADASWARAVPTFAPTSAPATNSDIKKLRILLVPLIANFLLERVGAGLAGADANDLFNRGDEDLSVTDLSRARGAFDGFDRLIDDVVRNGRLDLHFRQEVDDILRAPIELGVPFLSAEAFHLGHRDTRDADGRQRFTRFVQLERLDDCGNELHVSLAVVC